MTNKTELPANLQPFVAAWSLLSHWDESIGGPRPTANHIKDAIAVMSKPGGKPAVLNQGLRAFVLGFRAAGSTDGQRAYASMAGAPHNNVGKLGDALRQAFGTSRLETGKTYSVTLPGGRVTITSDKAGHVHFEVAERFTADTATAAPVKAKDKATKAPKGKAKDKAPKAEAPTEPTPMTDDDKALAATMAFEGAGFVAPTPDSVSEGDALAMQG